MGLTRKSSSSRLLHLQSDVKQIIKRCSSIGKKLQLVGELGFRSDVPKGHFVAYVGENRRRHIVPIPFLNHPQFQLLLQEAAEEFGFDQDTGLVLPCSESVFLSLIKNNSTN